jgi:hypothetical protein
MSRHGLLLLAFAVALAAPAGCGGGDPLDKHTPGVTPQPVRTPAGTGAAAKATPTPSARPARPVTREEIRVIRGWSDALRHGHVARAARYFARPATVSNGTPAIELRTPEQVQAFNAGLSCGAKLTRTKRAPHAFVYGVFKLTERPGGACGSGTGNEATVAFRVRHRHIEQWLRVPNLAPPGGQQNAS